MSCYKCPVCGGRGLVPNGFYNITDDSYYTNSTSAEPCKTCHGTGIVWEPVNDIPFITGLTTEDSKIGCNTVGVTTVNTNENVNNITDRACCATCDFHKKHIGKDKELVCCLKYKSLRRNYDVCQQWRRTTASNSH